MKSYHADLDTPLLRFGNEPWRIRDAAEGTAVWGAPGSGKSSGSGQTIAKAFLSAGMGGLVLCAKIDEVDAWRRFAAETGRADDLLIVDESGAQRFNILDYAAQNLARPGFEGNLVTLMAHMGEAARIADTRGATGGGDNRYFEDSALKWISHAFPLLSLAYGTLRMRDLYDFIVSAPQSPAAVPKDLSSLNPKSAIPFFQKTLILAGKRVEKLTHDYRHARATGSPSVNAAKARLDYAHRLIEEHGDFFLDEFPRLDSRPRTSTESTLTNLISPFLAGKLAELFCTTTTFTPSLCREGKVIVLNLPTLAFGAAGATAQTLVKYIFGISVQNDQITPETRPCFIYADEAQFFLNSADADLLSTARSAKLCIVYLTQDLPTYYAKLGAGSRDVADSMLSKFGTRIFHANTSRETNLAAAEIIGKVEKFHLTSTVTHGSAVGAGGNMHDSGSGFHGNDGRNRSKGQSTAGYLDFAVPPDTFATKLRTGSKRNGHNVDAIVIRNGRNWRTTKRHWIGVTFSQK